MMHQDTSMHVLSAVAAIGALGKENRELSGDNQKLIRGAANQAATIRTLEERNSKLEAEVTLEKYNVEFLKNQGRKTRLKNRETKKALGQARNHLGQVLDRAERAEAANAALSAAMSKLVAEKVKLLEEKEKLELAIDRMVEGERLPFQIVTEKAPFHVLVYKGGPRDFQMDQVVVRQLGMSLRIAPEHRRDLLAHAAMAKEAAAKVTEKMELAILEALRAEPVTFSEINQARHAHHVERAKRFMDPDFYRHPLF